MKIKNNIPADNRNGFLDAVLDPYVLALLEDDYIYVGDYDEYDFVLEDANSLADENKPILPNTIAFERIDGCQIRNKKLLKSDNLIRLVKSYKYKDLEVNNLNCVTKRIFTRLLTNENLKSPEIILTKEMLDKVWTGLSFWHYSCMEQVSKFISDRTLANKRKTDIFFAGVTNYGDDTHEEGKLITKHRHDCISAIHKLKGVDVFTAFNRVMTKEIYLEQTYNTKIIISPWGWGESCYRDYEALTLGCTVIKPRSYDIVSHPNIYSDNMLYWCKPDWSDLPEVVDKVLSEYDSREGIRNSIKDYLLHAQTKEYKVMIMKGILYGN